MRDKKFQELLTNCEDLHDLVPVIVAEIESNDLTLLKLVELLGPPLTDTNKDKRKQGVSFLVSVLKLIKPNLLNEAECGFMVTFFCDRLRDHFSITPHSLVGLSALSEMDNFSDDSPSQIVLALQENVTCQALNQHQRNSFYSIMNNILDKKSNKVASGFPTDYIYTLISAMDSESDPRNLLFLFSFLPKVFSEIPLKHLTEEAFAVLECYFPVDFSPAEEKGRITREDLAGGLEACFTSNPSFAEYCIPMICEKFESSLKVAQIDSLHLIINGFKCWNVESANSVIKRLWFCIKDVLIPGNDQEVSVLATEALMSLLSAYSINALSEEATNAFTFLLENISSSTHSYLCDPSLSLFVPSVRLLTDVIAVSSSTADFFIPKIMPQFLALLEIKPHQKDIILKALPAILVSSIRFNCWNNDSCREHLEKLMPILINSLEDEKCQRSCFACLTAIINKLSGDDRLLLYKIIQKIICSESFQSSREEFAGFIKTLSFTYPSEVKKNLISSFKIPEDTCFKEARNYLELLTWTLESPNLIQGAAEIILNHITSNELAKWRPDAVFVLRDYVYKGDSKVIECLGLACKFPEKLLHAFFDSEDEEDVIKSVAAIVASIIRVLDSGEPRYLLVTVLELFKKTTSINDTPSNQLILLEGLACGLKKEVEIPNCLQLCEFLIDYSISTSGTEVAKISAARLFAIIINKMDNGLDLDNLLTLAKAKIGKETSSSSVRLSAWITKSLILKGFYPVCDHWLVELLNLVSHPSYGLDAADCVRLLLEECPFLSTDNHCNVGFLYRQRIFQKIDILIPQNGKPSKSVSLALAYMLKYSPSSLVLGVIGRLAGVLVHCLELEEPNIVFTILGILSSLLDSYVEILCTLANTFIPKCIFLAQNSSFMAVRQEALNCLYHYGKYNSADILPYKKMVLAGCKKCLDDKKRLVRNCAVRARTRWFLV